MQHAPLAAPAPSARHAQHRRPACPCATPAPLKAAALLQPWQPWRPAALALAVQLSHALSSFPHHHHATPAAALALRHGGQARAALPVHAERGGAAGQVWQLRGVPEGAGRGLVAAAAPGSEHAALLGRAAILVPPGGGGAQVSLWGCRSSGWCAQPFACSMDSDRQTCHTPAPCPPDRRCWACAPPTWRSPAPCGSHGWSSASWRTDAHGCGTPTATPAATLHASQVGLPAAGGRACCAAAPATVSPPHATPHATPQATPAREHSAP